MSRSLSVYQSINSDNYECAISLETSTEEMIDTGKAVAVVLKKQNNSREGI